MKSLVLPILVLALIGCRDEPRPVPLTPEREAPTDNLRPLTSRDDAGTSLPTPGGGLPPGHPPIDGTAKAGAATGAVTGTISVAPQVASRLAAKDVLFIVARSAATHQVVAVRKEDAAAFPFAFQISGADAMVDGTSFTGPFEITARISKSGDAIPASGDIEGVARNVATGASGVAITLDSIRQ
jgi:cytochrome c-type biogenesis protein CcmH